MPLDRLPVYEQLPPLEMQSGDGEVVSSPELGVWTEGSSARKYPFAYGSRSTKAAC